MSKIPVKINKDVVDLLGLSGEELERHVHEELVIALYRRHEVSAMRASQLLGMEFMAFLRWSGERGVPYLDMTEEEWEEEARTVRELSASLASRR